VNEAAARAPQPSVAGLDELVGRMQASGLHVDMARQGPEVAVSASVGLAAYRIVQEALTNTLRHAPAARASIMLRYVSIDQFRHAREDEDGVLATIATLCAEGQADHIILSHDHVPEWDWRPHPPHTGVSAYCYLPLEVRPKLQSLGVQARAIDDMLIAAPAAFLGGGRT
jgi:hypothetical protein